MCGAVYLLIKIGFATSKSEARWVVQQKGVKISGHVVDDPDAIVEIPKDGVLLQKGKRHFVRAVART